MTAITTTLLPQIGKAKTGHAPGHAAKAGAGADMPDFLSLGAIETPEVAGKIAAIPAGKIAGKTPATDAATALLSDTPVADLPSELPVIGERHQSAEDGKDLPQGDAQADTSDDASPEAQMEAAIAWLMPVPTPEPVVSKAVAAPVAPNTPKIAAVTAQAPVVTLAAAAQPAPAQPQAAPVAQAQPPAAPATPQAPAQPIIVLQQQAASPAPARAPAAREVAPAEPRLRAASVAAPVQPLATSATPALAQFATRATERASEAAPRRRVAEAITGADLRAAAPVEAPAIAVTQTADAQNGTLDMSRQDWPSKMVDHIEKLRDDVDANDTRIRLVPDQLGQVDVSIRQDGDTLHLHFATETQDAANLIQDAQPVLADLAESRGLRLGQSSVDTGSSNTPGFADRQPNAQAQPNHNRFTRPAPAQADNDDHNPTDTRIA